MRARPVAETGHQQFRKPAERLVLHLCARRTDEGDALGKETATDEQKNLGRGGVQPLGVVDHTQQWVFLGDLRH